jgi:hypothetical protein
MFFLKVGVVNSGNTQIKAVIWTCVCLGNMLPEFLLKIVLNECMKFPNIQSYEEFSVHLMFYNRPVSLGKRRKTFLCKTIRQSYPCTDLDRLLRFEEFEVSAISRKPAHECGKVVISAQRPSLPPPRRYF